MQVIGQEFKYNFDIHTVITTIKEPFWSAGKKLGWDKPAPGLGFNDGLMQYIIRRKANLIVHVEGHKYFIPFNRLMLFIQNNNCDWFLRDGMYLRVISWKEFIRCKDVLH